MAKDLEMGYLLDFYGEVLTPKQREMLRQYYNDDLSLSEIGENFGITRQGAGMPSSMGRQPCCSWKKRWALRPVPPGAVHTGAAGAAGHRHPVRVYRPRRLHHHH